MNEKGSRKVTNGEIVKALIVIAQDFYENNNPSEGYAVTIDETNLVGRISQALHSYRRQKDRIADIMDGMQKIVSGS
jgi:hypothetical protein